MHKFLSMHEFCQRFGRIPEYLPMLDLKVVCFPGIFHFHGKMSDIIGITTTRANFIQQWSIG